MIISLITLVLVLAHLVLNLVLELPHRRGLRVRHLKRAAADDGIALAERMHRAGGLPKDAKLTTAVQHAAEELAHFKVKTTPAELRKLIEVRLEKARG